MSKNDEWLTTFAETPPTSCHMIQLSMFLHKKQLLFTSIDGEHVTIFIYTVDDVMHVYF